MANLLNLKIDYRFSRGRRAVLRLCAASVLAAGGCSRGGDGDARTAESAPAASAMPPATGRSAGLRRLEQEPVYQLEMLGTAAAPFANQPVRLPRTGEIVASGWAVDPATNTAADGVDVVIDGIPYAAQHGMDRPDVANYHKVPGYLKSGFELVMPAESLPAGDHHLSVRVLPAGGTAYAEGPPLTFRLE